MTEILDSSQARLEQEQADEEFARYLQVGRCLTWGGWLDSRSSVIHEWTCICSFPVLKTQFDAEEASSLQQQRSYRVREPLPLCQSAWAMLYIWASRRIQISYLCSVAQYHRPVHHHRRQREHRNSEFMKTVLLHLHTMCIYSTVVTSAIGRKVLLISVLLSFFFCSRVLGEFLPHQQLLLEENIFNVTLVQTEDQECVTSTFICP